MSDKPEDMYKFYVKSCIQRIRNRTSGEQIKALSKNKAYIIVLDFIGEAPNIHKRFKSNHLRYYVVFDYNEECDAVLQSNDCIIVVDRYVDNWNRFMGDNIIVWLFRNRQVVSIL